MGPGWSKLGIRTVSLYQSIQSKACYLQCRPLSSQPRALTNPHRNLLRRTTDLPVKGDIQTPKYKPAILTQPLSTKRMFSDHSGRTDNNSGTERSKTHSRTNSSNPGRRVKRELTEEEKLHIRDKILYAFGFDDDKSCKVSFHHLKKVTKQLKLNLSDEKIQSMISRADTNGDGMIDLSEFIEVMRRTSLY